VGRKDDDTGVDGLCDAAVDGLRDPPGVDGLEDVECIEADDERKCVDMPANRDDSDRGL